MATIFKLGQYNSHVGAFKVCQAVKNLFVPCSSIKVRFNSNLGNILHNYESNKLKSFGEEEVIAKLSNGKDLRIASGKFAKLADGCAVVTLENTAVLATAVSKSKNSEGVSFTPLTVSYQQKAAALGRIPLNFYRRESKLSEYEILTSRVIDRSIRPLFGKGFNWDTQILCSPLALDGSNLPDVLCINAASAALAISDIPWNGPVGAVRIGLEKENIFINPTKKELAFCTFNVILACRQNKLVVMMEGFGSDVFLQTLMKGIKQGIKECQTIIREIENLRHKCGKEKRNFELPEVDSNLKEAVVKQSYEKLKAIFQNYSHNKLSRDEEIFSLENEILKEVKTNFGDKSVSTASEIFHNECKRIFRDLIFENEVRCDGRQLSDLRNIKCEIDLFEPLHGSALFQRGQTQVMCTVSLDSANSALKMDNVSMLMSGLKEKSFFVHYEFPPYATKEVGRTGLIGRREMGHGALAEKALKGGIPHDFPFTIRLNSEVMESNGSSSMATVCGGTLALMDAGVPIQNPCAGVAMGLVSKYSDENPLEITEYKIMTDILGIEDHFGDMDFKIAGTKKYLTAFQLDLKNEGLPLKIIGEVLVEAKSAIGQILTHMLSVCSSTRHSKKANWPASEKIIVPPHLRKRFVGIGGINLKKLEVENGVEITEDTPNEFVVFAPNKTVLNEAKEIITSLLESHCEPVLEFGGVYTATVVEIKERGIMVTLYKEMPPALIHISQLDQRKVSHPSALGIQVGQQIEVKYFGRDPVSGIMRLSRKVLQAASNQPTLNLSKKDSLEEEKANDWERENISSE